MILTKDPLEFEGNFEINEMGGLMVDLLNYWDENGRYRKSGIDSSCVNAGSFDGTWYTEHRDITFDTVNVMRQF